MEKSQRIAIAKEILELIDGGQPYYGDESWEGDVGRFIDQERFELEKQKLFLERPQLIALSADLPSPGDYFATDIAGKPILIVRGKDGTVQAFLNACRHRGVKLAEEGCGHGKGFACPYHGWTFNNEGELISVPSRSAFDVEQLANRDLIRLPTHEEIGVIAVHPQPDATLDFDEFLGPMKGVLEDIHLEEFELMATRREVARINWKHAVDGGMEAYHVPFLHPTTFGTDGGGFLPHKQFGDHHAFINSAPEILELKDKPESEWPHSCHWWSVNAIFPNTVIGGGGPRRGGVLFFQRTEPMNEAGTCNYNFRLYCRGTAASEEEKASREASVNLFLKVAFEEDLPVQVSSQIMMEAGAVRSVLFGKREACLTGMHKGYDEAIGHDAKAALLSNSKAMGV
ncbi:MAG TPA: aromatic ring-hydroxylating dioxygenase subunit alpha [Alphaproteobacteria bacterium]|nr:aromatic ring-hydroxylating dioxygenase subunit alpha [Alphaproteobacteria bacterium]